jgi:hypothetical protein
MLAKNMPACPAGAHGSGICLKSNKIMEEIEKVHRLLAMRTRLFFLLQARWPSRLAVKIPAPQEKRRWP